VLKARLPFKILGMSVLASTLCCAACAVGSTGSVSSTAAPTSTATVTPAPPKHYTIGDLVTIGTAWQVRISGFRLLGPGDTPSVQQVGIDMTLKNIGAQASSFDDNYVLTFEDSEGRRHGIGQ
jgi:hypothetical protein